VHEHFPNFSTTVSGDVTALPDVDNQISSIQALLGDTQFIGTFNPDPCLGPNEHEIYDQIYTVIVDTKQYPQTMTNHIEIGYFNGKGNVTITIKQP